MGTKNHQKTLKIWDFSPKWRQKQLLVLVFGDILVLHPQHGRFSQKSPKKFLGCFFYIFGVKVEKFQKFLKSYKNFLPAIF